MNQKIDCKKCGMSFAPLKTRFADMVRRFAKGGQNDLGIECPHCGKYTNFNPIALMEGKSAASISSPYRCPVSACTGYVSFVEETDEDEAYWGCGECGSIWYKKKKLLAEITSILKKFPYREKSYRKSKGEWIPAETEKEVGDYEERVDKEPEDESDEYERG